MRNGLMLTCLALCACGSSNGSSGLNAAFAKTWTGTTTTTVSGQTFTGTNGHLTITVSGNNATVNTVCPDASGSVNATGSGNSASWSGTLACPPVQVTGCPSSLTLTYTTATLTLSSDNKTLNVQAGGTVSGCNFNNTPFTTTFAGT